jgi:predicted nucleotidyltransferase
MRKLSRCRKISESDRQLMLELKRIVTSMVPGAEVILYGSAARGTREPDSDYDVLVLSPRRVSSAEERELESDIYDLMLDKDVVISTLVYAQDEWKHPIFQASPYYRNIRKDGIVL